MPFPPPAPRQHLHTRTATYRGYLRDDSLWDVEAEMVDARTYDAELSERGPLPGGEPVHGLAIRMTLDVHMTIRAIAVDMPATPFAECAAGSQPMQAMLGVRLGPGWRQAIEQRVGGASGCTHLRELLFNMATVAYQTVHPWQERERRRAGAQRAQLDRPPYHLGRCVAWSFDGAVVQRHYPQFVGWQPLTHVPRAKG